MTNLTDKWKKGELPDGKYWVMLDVYGDGEPELSDVQISDGSPIGWCDKSIKEVLAEVPSYEEWQAKNVALTTLLAEYGKLTKELQDEKEKHMTRPSLRSPADEVVVEKQVWQSTLNRSMVLEAENEQLKDLLKEIRGKLHYINTPVNQHNIFSNDFIKRLDQVLGEE